MKAVNTQSFLCSSQGGKLGLWPDIGCFCIHSGKRGMVTRWCSDTTTGSTHDLYWFVGMNIWWAWNRQEGPNKHIFSVPRRRVTQKSSKATFLLHGILGRLYTYMCIYIYMYTNVYSKITWNLNNTQLERKIIWSLDIHFEVQNAECNFSGVYINYSPFHIIVIIREQLVFPPT